jgi:hypothetical protein
LGVGSTALILIEAPSSAYPGGLLRVTTTLVTNKEETSRRFSTNQHPFYCGIDLHARTMYVCVLSQSGDVLVHRTMQTDPETFLKAIAPYRQGLVVAVAVCSPGTGSPTSGPTKASLLSWGMLSP